jgi:hypothetical protein
MGNGPAAFSSRHWSSFLIFRDTPSSVPFSWYGMEMPALPVLNYEVESTTPLKSDKLSRSSYEI